MASPPDAWQNALCVLKGPETLDLLSVKTLLFPNFFQGQQLTPVNLLEILKAAGTAKQPCSNDQLLQHLALDKILSGNSNEFFFRIARKQIFDARDPNYAAMTMILGVGTSLEFDKVCGMKPLADNLRIDVPKRPSLDTVGLLQLVSTSIRYHGIDIA